MHWQVCVRPCLILEKGVVGLIANLQKYSKNILIEVEEITYLAISKGRKHNSDVDKYRNKSESLQNVTAIEEPNASLMILLLGLSTN